MIYEVFKRRASEHTSVLLNVFWLTVLFASIAPTIRYLPLYTPFIALGIAYGCDVVWNGVSRWSHRGHIAKRLAQWSALIAFGFLVGHQVVFAVHSNHLAQPFNDSSFWLSRARSEYRGFRELDNVVTHLLRESRPLRPISFADYHNIPDTADKASGLFANEKLRPFSSLIVYDENIDWFGRFWTLERWMKINYIPVLSIENTLLQASTLRGQFVAAGIDSAYFIFPAGINVIPDSERDYEDRAAPLRNYFDKQGIEPIQEIRNAAGELSFVIYFIDPLWETLDRVFGASNT